MKKLALTLLLSSGILCQLYAFNRNEIHWYEGAIALKNGEVLRGLVSFDDRIQLLQFKEGVRVSTFSALQVAEFRYFDVEGSLHHKYRTFQRPNRYGYPIAEFYEIVFIGEIDLVRKKRKHRRAQAQLEKGSYSHLSQDEKAYLISHVLDFNYFFRYKEAFYPINRFYKEVLPLLMEDYPFLNRMVDLDRHKRKKENQVVKLVQLINCTLKEGCNDSQLSMLD